jgi:hypothetical protein
VISHLATKWIAGQVQIGASMRAQTVLNHCHSRREVRYGVPASAGWMVALSSDLKYIAAVRLVTSAATIL